MTSLTVNCVTRQVEATPETPLLWVLRDHLALTGTKFGCGAGLCGACTVHMDRQAVRSCQVPLGDADGASIITIEALAAVEEAGDLGRRVQVAWIAEQVPQCGYCQSGMIMTATALLRETPAPTDADIDAAMTNICRCGTYSRVRAAIHRVAGGL